MSTRSSREPGEQSSRGSNHTGADVDEIVDRNTGSRENARPSWFSRHRSAIIGVLVVIVYLIIGSSLFHYFLNNDQHDASAAEAYYLTVSTFLTIGYGDVSPESSGAKIFAIFFILGSLVVQTFIFGSVLSHMADASERRLFRKKPKDSAHAYLRLKPQIMHLARAAIVMLLVALLGTLLMMCAERRSFLNSLYWTVVTLTTVGYGDITPTAHKAVFATYSLITVLAFGFLVGRSVGLLLDAFKLHRLRRFFQDGLTMDMLERMDTVGDGHVHRYEFMLFMLREMDLVGMDQLERILGIFQLLDADGDGVLNVRDVHLMDRLGKQKQIPHNFEAQDGSRHSGTNGQRPHADDTFSQV